MQVLCLQLEENLLVICKYFEIDKKLCYPHKLYKLTLKILGLKPSEGAANTEIQLLASVHTSGLILIWSYQRIHGSFYIFVSDS